MNNQAHAIIALGGLSAGAMGQSLSVELSWDSTSISLGETATATLIATFDGFAAGSYLSSVNIDLIADEQAGEVSNVGAIAWNNAGLGFDGQGTASGANILGIEAAQYSLIPPFTTNNPIMIMTFEFTASDIGPSGYPRIPTYRARTVDGAPFAFSVTGPNFSDQPLGFGPDALVPAPGVVGLLCGVGLLGGRRRR